MLEFIQLLKQRYQSALAHSSLPTPQFADYQQRIEQLILAESVIRKGQLILQQQRLPLQIAVIGPTQAGKSSVVNLLLNSSQAGVSPLAGYTVHPHGFIHQLPATDCASLSHYFGRFQCVPESELRRDRYDCYTLNPSYHESPVLPAGVLWDTPDFDSIDACDYQEGVIRTIALADVLVLVVSKEKYADQAVWHMMTTLAPLQQPVLICLNKLVEGSENIISASLKDKWHQVRSDPFPEVVPLLFNKHSEQLRWPESARHALHALAKRASAKQHADRQQQLLQRYWSLWLEPVFAEQQTRKNWCSLVDHSLKQLADDYRRDYLNHPHHYQTFQAALVNLLNLLEIPGLATVLGKTRRLMTWPVRQLLSAGKNRHAPVNHEVAVLKQLGEHLLIQLAEQLLEKAELDAGNSRWWKDALSSLRSQKPQLLAHYSAAIERYHLSFQQDVDTAAHKLYHRLQQQPMILNSLRATRVGTDAAALALVLQTGGIGLHDLVLTPAMLTVTSLLAESAIGSYMQRVEAELKQQQLTAVQTQLFDHALRSALYALPDHFAEPPRFYIPNDTLHQAEQALKEKRHGLRIL